jgi:glutathione S-transferase
MIKIHHLADSRSTKILWLLEELGLDYEIVPYPRYKGNLAPPELKAVHPLGKSPVIEDGRRTIAESGAIVEYLVESYGEGRLKPAKGTDDWARYLQWLQIPESSVMLPLILAIYVEMLGEAGKPLHPRVHAEVKNHLDFMAAELEGRDFIVGNDLTGADFQVTFTLESAMSNNKLDDYPTLRAYVARMQARPAYRRALEKGGSYDLRRLFGAR